MEHFIDIKYKQDQGIFQGIAVAILSLINAMTFHGTICDLYFTEVNLYSLESKGRVIKECTLEDNSRKSQ